VQARLQAHPAVREAIVVAAPAEAPGDVGLVAYYVGEPAGDAAALRRWVAAALPDYMVPAAYVRLAALPLTPSGKLDRRALPAPDAAALATRGYEAPEGATEQALAALWAEVLRVERVGRHDDFFALGGHSLVAVRLFARIKKQFRADYPMSALFEAPTVERLAAMLKRDGVVAAAGDAPAGKEAAEAAPRHRYRHLVAMHPSRHGDGRPFFLVAGMFGNVLNLRHLAQLCGGDRPFYGLQARGLFGDMAPHATFEEAARDHIAELRLVQPKGPYLLGGFSGGGITAFEMSKQLRAAGEQVVLLVLLDTPLPTQGVVGRADRLRIQWQRLRRQGPAYLWRWLRNRVAWEIGKLRRRFGVGGDDETAAPTSTFHSQAIEAAFRAALPRYRVEALPVRTWLFRPALDRTYDLGGGRFANKDRELVLPDNGWTPWLADLTVVETPGDHDSMVLEPNVRTMAAKLREALQSADGAQERPRP
jgi:thioesterase domain-containing protein/acyl carrier protein